MERYPSGDRMRPARCETLTEALGFAQKYERKIWAIVIGEYGVLYEVWPGGKNIRWPLEVLSRWTERQAVKAARTR